MKLEVFWNKAIEYYCTINEYEIVFIAISEESLEKIYTKYLDSNLISLIDRDCIKKNVENCFGIKNSYYSAIKIVQNNIEKPGTYSFLRFSIFTIVGFNLDNDVEKGYWNSFDSFLTQKRIQNLNQNSRTDYINKLITNLSSYCKIKGKYFFNINIYGHKTSLVNIGRIKAHFLFQGRTIKKIKISIYKLNLEKIPVEFWTDDNLKSILEKSEETRILNIYNANIEAKELIHECLKIWLQNWEPLEKEQIKLNFTNTSDFKKNDNNLFRLWVLENKKFIWKYGFILNYRLGSEGRVYSTNNEDVYINLDISFKIKENQYLYIIENHDTISKIHFNEGDLNLSFKPIAIKNDLDAFILRKISSGNNFPVYFLQLEKNKISLSNEQIFIASSNEISELNNISNNVGIFDSPIKKINIYRIRDDFKNTHLHIIKTNNEIEIKFSGISDGERGTKSFIKKFPIKINYGNILNGIIEIYNINGKKIFFYEVIATLNSSIELPPNLDSGEYQLKIKINNNYVNFPGNPSKDYIPFEIVENGIKDDREVLKIICNKDFIFEKQKNQLDLNILNPSFILLFDSNNFYIPKYLNHNLFDFCFSKNKFKQWIISINKETIYAFIVNGIDENNFKVRKFNYPSTDYKYIDKQNNIYSYELKCLFDTGVTLKINNEMFIDNFFPNKDIHLNCFCFELISFDDKLMAKYNYLKEGDKIYIITNFNDRLIPEKLIKTINQEIFPFKILKDANIK